MMDGLAKIFRHVKCDAIILDVDIYTCMFCSPMTNLYSSEVDSKPDILWQYIFFFIYTILFNLFFSLLFISYKLRRTTLPEGEVLPNDYLSV